MSSKIFISYRLSDEPGFVGRLYDRLSSVFGKDQIFMDVKGIPAGHDFGETIEQHVRKSDVVLAMIGTRWFANDPGNGKRRIDDETDWVRREIAEGLKVKNRVIPILINDRAPLPASDLPEPISALAKLQALELTHKHFDANVEKIGDEIKQRMDEIASAKSAPKTWDQTSFFEATENKRASLEPRFLKVIAWAKAKHSLRWGQGAKIGSFLVSPKGTGKTAISCDTAGTFYVFLKGLQDIGVLPNLQAREAFIDQLNTVQGLSIAKDRAKNDYAGFQINYVEIDDIDQLLGIFDQELASVVTG